ncbi:hypothetical protein EVAR_29899_1 [Eumeta japonica]|uniref:Reverse transcriptase domain-containing protein n=1 Tax=Eumeta variegata TaxID=151549 RepID=A0A4C1V972_EUMVA|nr:hypothetical protein EVAR_29899_1 [Eumeta japonica]
MFIIVYTSLYTWYVPADCLLTYHVFIEHRHKVTASAVAFHPFGFTKGRSTTEAGVELIEQIFGAWEELRDAISVFCDLSKAFYWIHNDTFIRKLHHYGVRDLLLLESYLSGKVQSVDVNDYFLSKAPVTPLVFPPGLYVFMGGNDHLLLELKDFAVYVQAFAYEVDLVTSGQSASTLEAEANRKIVHIKDWTDQNKLKFVPSKTKAMDAYQKT